MQHSEELKIELKAVENIVLEYEKSNRNVMEEIELQANQNEEILN